MRADPIGPPSRRGEAIGGEKRDIGRASAFDTDVARRAGIETVGDAVDRNVQPRPGEAGGWITSAGVDDDDFDRDILIEERADGVDEERLLAGGWARARGPQHPPLCP